MHTFEYLSRKVNPPFVLSEGPVGIVLGKGGVG